MRRLDYFSTIIIAVCVAAAAFLVYVGVKAAMNKSKDAQANALYNGKRTYNENEKDNAHTIDEKDLLGEEQAASKQRTPAANAIQNEPLSPPNDENLEYDFLDERPKTRPATTANQQPTKTSAPPPISKPNTPRTRTTNSPVRKGDFMVLAGSFREEINAEREATRLRKLGFQRTRVERFDKGAFAVLVVDRFTSRGQAEALTKDLAKQSVDSYVKLKQ
ncbi:MAG: SPOR domain-containing protein [Bacteroidota bacterium]